MEGKYTIFKVEEYNKIYDLIYDWLTAHTPGSRTNKRRFQYYQKELWNPIIRVIKELYTKDNLNEKEKEFLNLATYTGPIYRIQNYWPKRKGHIYEGDFYQSWSRNLEGVANLPTIWGNVILIIGYAVNGINLYGVLEFLIVNEYITPSRWKDPRTLERYLEEEEIVYPLQFEYVADVVVVDKEKLLDWDKHKSVIPREKWKRNSIN